MNYRDPGTPFIVALVGVPVIACVVFEVAYQVSRRISGVLFSDSITYSLVAACTLIGVGLIQFNGKWSVRRRVIAAIVYFPVMYAFVLLSTGMYMFLRGAIG